jgi:REP element-mobilizing transposase RayT
MQYRFGNIENDEMTLNEYGTIAYNEWIKLTERFSNFELDVFQIMPNHMRSIIALNPVRAGFTPAQIIPKIMMKYSVNRQMANRNDITYI